MRNVSITCLLLLFGALVFVPLASAESSVEITIPNSGATETQNADGSHSVTIPHSQATETQNPDGSHTVIIQNSKADSPTQNNQQSVVTGAAGQKPQYKAYKRALRQITPPVHLSPTELPKPTKAVHQPKPPVQKKPSLLAGIEHALQSVLHVLSFGLVK